MGCLLHRHRVEEVPEVKAVEEPKVAPKVEEQPKPKATTKPKKTEPKTEPKVSADLFKDIPEVKFKESK